MSRYAEPCVHCEGLMTEHKPGCPVLPPPTVSEADRQLGIEICQRFPVDLADVQGIIEMVRAPRSTVAATEAPGRPDIRLNDDHQLRFMFGQWYLFHGEDRVMPLAEVEESYVNGAVEAGYRQGYEACLALQPHDLQHRLFRKIVECAKLEAELRALRPADAHDEGTQEGLAEIARSPSSAIKASGE